MNARISAPTSGVLALLLAAPLAAQQPPPPAPAPASPTPETVLLAYKFRPGQLQRFRANLSSQATFTRDGDAPAGGGSRPTSLEMEGEMTYTEKVLGVQAGAGTVLLTPLTAQATVNVSSMNLGLKLVNGKMVATRNGQPLSPREVPSGLNLAALQPAPTTIYRSPSGPVKVERNGTVENASDPRCGGMPLSAVSEFPDRPVKIGEKWETRRLFVGPGLGLSLPGPAGISNLRLTHTLKSIQRQGRRLIAVIETSGENADLQIEGAENPPGAAPRASGLVQTLVGVTYFDVERGALMASRFAAELTGMILATSGMPGSPGVAGASGGGLLRVDGQIGVKLAEVIEVPAPVIRVPKPPVKQKPTPRTPSAPRRR